MCWCVPPHAHAAAVQIATIIEALMTVSLVVLFMGFGAHAWRLVRRAENLLQNFSLQGSRFRLRSTVARNDSVVESAMSEGRRMRMRVVWIVVVVVTGCG